MAFRGAGAFGRWLAAGLFVVALAMVPAATKSTATTGAPISYRLPGPPGTVWRVTLAITAPDKPDWIVSTFLPGAPRVVTVENGGQFTETWDGLDENFMPVPPGTYGVKGICMPAAKWEVDGLYHSVTAKYAGMAQAWQPPLAEDRRRPVVEGDPIHSPLRDVDIGVNGHGVFCFQYLENGRNFFIADFNRPVGYEQVLSSHDSGGVGGGASATTDGTHAWIYLPSEKIVFRADQAWGQAAGRHRKGVYQPAAPVTGLAAWRDEPAAKTFVYLAEANETNRKGAVVVLDGDTAKELANIPLEHPLAIVARWGHELYALHHSAGGLAVSAMALEAGRPAGSWRRVLNVPADLRAFDCEVDSRGNIYLSDPAANQVYQFSPQGKKLRAFGRAPAQTPGSYDPETLMAPGKLACWRDAEGRDRIVIVENEGPNRTSEWSSDGKLLREWMSPQTFSNLGYAVDPRQPDRFYIQGQGGWLLRLRVDYASGKFATDAVWPGVFTGRFGAGQLGFPKLLYRGDTRYLAFGRGYVIFREDKDRWVAAAGLIEEKAAKKNRWYVWRDENGDGQTQTGEYRSHPTSPPRGTMRYWGESWLDDFSLAAIQLDSPDVWRLPATGFDSLGNPLYPANGWTKLLTDPVFAAHQAGAAPALFGGNEAGDSYNSAWGMVAGSLHDGFYVNARSGDAPSANFGTQQKLSYYAPAAGGGFAMKWRVGRVALDGTAQPGEIYSSIQLTPPTNGILSITDQTRMGLLLYTTDGLYVDTLFADNRTTRRDAAVGPYLQPGEQFHGHHFSNRTNGKIYVAFGKVTPELFETVGWTTTESPVRPLQELDREVTLAAAQIAAAPAFALAARKSNRLGTAASGQVARFAPLPGGGPALDGSLRGWETCVPLSFQSDETQQVEVRCGYDPANLYLRWHVRLGRKFEARELAPADRLFTHDRAADTLGFYIQGDPAAAPATGREGRNGDARFVFGLFRDAGEIRPAVLSLYPKSNLPDASPLTYATPAGSARFEHVGLLATARLGYQLDADGEGFVLAAALPRSAVPLLPAFTGAFATRVDFDANLGGHNRFWWANADGSASQETYDEPSEAQLYPGAWAQAQFESVRDLPVRNWSVIGPFGDEKLPQLRQLEDRKILIETLADQSYPPEAGVDPDATYAGGLTQTRLRQRTLRWTEANVTEDRVPLEKTLNNGWAKGHDQEGVAYLVTYLHTPLAGDIDFRVVEEEGDHVIRAWLNSQPLPTREDPKRPARPRLDESVPLHLQAGWNQLLVRYDRIWGSDRVGLRLNSQPEKLWQLGFSGTASRN